MRKNVPAENTISFGVSDELHHSFHVIAGKRAAVGTEWKSADAYVDPLLFGLIFRETDTGEFGIGVDDTGNGFVVHVASLTRDDFDRGDPFVLGFVRKHRTGDDIADGVNPFDICVEM